MFDAKSLLEMMVQGAATNARQPQSGGGLGDLLGQLLGGAGAQATPSRGAAGSPGGIGGLEDLLRQFGGGGGAPASSRAAPAPNATPGAGQSGGNPLEDILRNLTSKSGGGSLSVPYQLAQNW